MTEEPIEKDPKEPEPIKDPKDPKDPEPEKPEKTVEELKADKEVLLQKIKYEKDTIEKCDRKIKASEDTREIMDEQMKMLDNYIEEFGDTTIHHPNSAAEMAARHFRKCLELEMQGTESYNYIKAVEKVRVSEDLVNDETKVAFIDYELVQKGEVL